MTNEEMERAIEFLLNNQAAFAASLEASKEAFAESLATSKADFDARQAAFAESLEASNAAFSARQDHTQAHLDHLIKVVAHIAEITQRNSEEIDILIKLTGGIVERGNGKPEK